jgi:hypothetical protein
VVRLRLPFFMMFLSDMVSQVSISCPPEADDS